MLRDVLTVILAGGKGTRLEPLTRDRAKPAVPFGGLYRIIDFTLSNCINSGLRRMRVLTQFKSHSLNRHVRQAWNCLATEFDESIEILPPQQRIDTNWYKGTADAIYQNIYSLERDRSEDMLILAGDHIYKMNYGKMLEFHHERGADVTIGCIPVPLAESRQFGIVQAGPDGRIYHFQEKPATAEALPDDPGHALGSMGIYIFRTRLLFERLCEDAAREDSEHDFGKNILPDMLRDGLGVYAYPFRDENRKEKAYWRDVGTLDAYYQANMDLIGIVPELNLYDAAWPIRAWQPQLPPPKFIFNEPSSPGHSRRGEALDSLVCSGVVVSGGHVRQSILSPNVRINSYAVVEESILFEGVDVGRYSRIRRAIIDKGVKLPPYTVLGYDAEFDRQRGFTITDNGIVVVAKAEPPETFRTPNALPK
ncbi:MAG: glucose-1-phosphate adenylyltransferase [Gemmataceae bacterium]